MKDLRQVLCLALFLIGLVGTTFLYSQIEAERQPPTQEEVAASLLLGVPPQHYTYTPPYTDHELIILTLWWASVICLILGGLMVLTEILNTLVEWGNSASKALTRPFVNPIGRADLKERPYTKAEPLREEMNHDHPEK